MNQPETLEGLHNMAPNNCDKTATMKVGGKVTEPHLLGTEGIPRMLAFQYENWKSLGQTKMTCSHGDTGQGQIMQEGRVDSVPVALRMKFNLPAMD